MSNLTRYNFWRDSIADCYCGMEEIADGEYVKFDDIKELLNTAHNSQSTPFCLQCHSPSKWVIACTKCGSIIEE